MTVEPMIVDTTVTTTGKRSVQMWVDGKRPECVAAVHVDNGTAVEFTINSVCPRDLIDRALGMYTAVREGGDVEATHTLQWKYGAASFTPLEPGDVS